MIFLDPRNRTKICFPNTPNIPNHQTVNFGKRFSSNINTCSLTTSADIKTLSRNDDETKLIHIIRLIFTLIYYFSFILDIFQQLITGLVCRLDRLQSIVDSVHRHRYYGLYSILIMTVILEWCWQAGAAVDRSEAGCARMRLFACGPPVYRVSATRANKDHLPQ